MPTIRQTGCCGLEEIDDVSYASQEQLRDAIRRAREHKAGRVFATTASGEGEANLKAVGFREIDKFVNPNTGNTVKIWLRSTLPPKPVTVAKRVLASMAGATKSPGTRSPGIGPRS